MNIKNNMGRFGRAEARGQIGGGGAWMRARFGRGRVRLSGLLGIFLGLLLGLDLPGHAIGIRTKFGEVIVRNLKIGRSYSMKNLLNLPLSLLYNGGKGDPKVDIVIEALIPPDNELKSGVLAVPTTSWIQIERSVFKDVDPGKEVSTDILVTLPNDERLLGRRYAVSIWSRTESATVMMGVGINSRLIIQVSSERPSEEELKQAISTTPVANLDFDVFPMEGVATDIPLGREVDLKKERKLSIKIINPNDAGMVFRLRSIGNWESLLTLPRGFEETPDPYFLKPAQERVEVGPNAIKDTPLLLKIPDEPRYRSRNFFFVVTVDVQGQATSAQVYYKLLVTTQSEAKQHEASQEEGSR